MACNWVEFTAEWRGSPSDIFAEKREDDRYLIYLTVGPEVVDAVVTSGMAVVAAVLTSNIANALFLRGLPVVVVVDAVSVDEGAVLFLDVAVSEVDFIKESVLENWSKKLEVL